MSIGLPGLLFIVFLVLKLTHVIEWSWLWVTSPLWIGFVLWLVIAIPMVLVGGSKAKKASREFDEFEKSLRRRR